MPRPKRRDGGGRRGRVVAVVVIAVLVVLVFSLRAIATFWTDYLWFADLDLSDVWTSLLSAKVSLRWSRRSASSRSSGSTSPSRRSSHHRWRPCGWTTRSWSATRRWSPVASGCWCSCLARSRARAGHQRRRGVEDLAAVPPGGDFGIEDPQFGWDIGFFVFRLPFFSLVVDWVFGFLLVTLLLVSVLYYLNGSIRFQARGDRITGSAKAHLSVILALMALVKAVDYWLQRFELTLQQRDAFDGAGYTAVNATLPALQLLILVALFAAGLFIVNIRRRGWVLPVIAIALWMVTSVVLATIYPAFVQRFQVSPAELNREPYIERNIEATRSALGLSEVESSDLNYSPDLTQEKLQAQREPRPGPRDGSCRFRAPGR
ncbi:MAG: UPF0182 family protein [Microthrixaceae bacterium]